MAQKQVDRVLFSTEAERLDALSAAGICNVAVVGGSGRLGAYLVRHLLRGRCKVHVLDSQPPDALPGVRFTACDLGCHGGFPADALRSSDAVVHLAGLHGAHLADGVSRRQFWRVNVQGTERVLEAAGRAGVRRVVIASSTSVYGSGSPRGQLARVLSESTELNPEDIYDLTKVAAERLLEEATDEKTGMILRFGRFFFPSHADYHLRKLSTGLDVRDACQAMIRALTAADPPRRAYCIASDLPLSVSDRQRLGVEARQVLDEALPGFGEVIRRRGMSLPDRVGKSVDTALARAELGYRPERALDWVATVWATGNPSTPARPRFRHLLLADRTLQRG
jgi:UDP-glucose 4-epimerase